MTAPDRAATLAHYEGQAALAALAELARWQGKGLTPQAGCGLHQCILGDADVWVEYEYEPASGDRWNEPREEASVTVICVLINGVMCDAQDVAPHRCEEWAVEIMQTLADEYQREQIASAQSEAAWAANASRK